MTVGAEGPFYDGAHPDRATVAKPNSRSRLLRW